MRSEDLLRRLHQQAVDILALVRASPPRIEARSTFEQICRCAPGARDNYRSACRGRSRREFVSRLGIALDEADETVGWLEIMRDAGLAPRDRVATLLAEAVELRAVLAKSYKTARTNLSALEAEQKRDTARRRRPTR